MTTTGDGPPEEDAAMTDPQEWATPTDGQEEALSSTLVAAEALEAEAQGFDRKGQHEAAAACYVAAMRLYQDAARELVALEEGMRTDV